MKCRLYRVDFLDFSGWHALRQARRVGVEQYGSFLLVSPHTTTLLRSTCGVGFGLIDHGYRVYSFPTQAILLRMLLGLS